MEPELIATIRIALETAKGQRKEAGPGDRGRKLSLTVTKLEEALLWARASDQSGLLPE